MGLLNTEDTSVDTCSCDTVKSVVDKNPGTENLVDIFRKMYHGEITQVDDVLLRKIADSDSFFMFQFLVFWDQRGSLSH